MMDSLKQQKGSAGKTVVAPGYGQLREAQAVSHCLPKSRDFVTILAFPAN